VLRLKFLLQLFKKDSPELCRQMAFAPKQNDLESPTAAPKKTPSKICEKMNEASQRHSILQVPSLASCARSVDGDSHSKAVAKATQWREEAELKTRAMHSPTITYPMAGRPVQHPGEAPIYMGHRMNEGFHYFPESPHNMRHLGTPGGLGAYDRHFMAQHPFEFAGPRFMHNSPRFQSGRGALRLSARATAQSNRGKGTRVTSTCRVVPSCDSSQAANASATKQSQSAELRGQQRFREKVAERVAVAVSKKTKRKLPISSGKAEEDKNNTKQVEDEGGLQGRQIEEV
jgi:hypothetical protein